jgi:hypothetical protein
MGSREAGGCERRRCRRGLDLILVGLRLLLFAIASHLAPCHVTLPIFRRNRLDRFVHPNKTWRVVLRSHNTQKGASATRRNRARAVAAPTQVPACDFRKKLRLPYHLAPLQCQVLIHLPRPVIGDEHCCALAFRSLADAGFDLIAHDPHTKVGAVPTCARATLSRHPASNGPLHGRSTPAYAGRTKSPNESCTIERDLVMTPYLIFAVGPNGNFVSVKELMASNDAVAIERARQLLDQFDLEVWTGGKKIGQLPTTRITARNFATPLVWRRTVYVARKKLMKTACFRTGSEEGGSNDHLRLCTRLHR